MMKTDKEIEKILLDDDAYEQLIIAKTQQEFMKNIDFSKREKTVVTDIKKVPSNKLFSKQCTYIAVNKKSKTKSYINGIQAEAFLGSQNIAREKLLAGCVDFFVNGDYYVKFYNYKF